VICCTEAVYAVLSSQLSSQSKRNVKLENNLSFNGILYYVIEFEAADAFTIN